MELYYGSYEHYFDTDDQEVLQEQIKAWNEALFEQLKEVFPELVEVTSSVEGQFSTLSDLHYGALLLTLLYKEEGTSAPSKMKNMWMEDKVFLKAQKTSSKTKYKLLVDLPEFLLPYAFTPTFTYIDVEENERQFASLPTLLTLLDEVNSKFFNLTDFSNQTQEEPQTTHEMAQYAFLQLYVAVRSASESNAILIIE